MGRKGSTLVPFLVEGLKGKKYGHYLIGDIDNVIQIILPRKTKNLCCESMKILKDWNFKKGRKFTDEKDYTKAKQGMLAALRRSDYLERIKHLKPKLCYKILNSKEVKEKKQKQKNKKLAAFNEIQSPSSVESGLDIWSESPMVTDLSEEIEVDNVSGQDLDYDSGFDSPVNLNESQFCEDPISPVFEPFSPTSQDISAAVTNESVFINNNILNAIKHDHDDYSSRAVQNPEAEIQNIIKNGSFTPLTDSEFQLLVEDVVRYDKSSFNDILNEDKVEQVYTFGVLKFKSEHMQGSFLTCELKDEKWQMNKSAYDSIPLNVETSQKLQPCQVVEVKEDKDNVLFLFSDHYLIVLDTDLSKRLKLSQIAEVKRLDKYVLFFLNPQKCFGSN